MKKSKAILIIMSLLIIGGFVMTGLSLDSSATAENSISLEETLKLKGLEVTDKYNSDLEMLISSMPIEDITLSSPNNIITGILSDNGYDFYSNEESLEQFASCSISYYPEGETFVILCYNE